ncbi:MAG: WYL domain-containing protein [Desulfobacteraceae bacterium]|nr:WYL domain-containing protein [Desulfobacteraceae bacterium]
MVEKAESGDIRTLAVERIQDVYDTHVEFDYPKNFNAEARINKTFGIIDDGPLSVKVLFSSTQARYVTERTWVEGQTVETNSDGSIILSFSTHGKYDVKKWVMGWGPDAIVIEPRELAEEIRQDLKKMLKNY